MHRNHFILACLFALLTSMFSIAYGQPSPTPEPETYVIQPGDTLSSIASRYNTTVRALAAENGITNTEQIYWGQRIRIPAAQPQDDSPTPEPTGSAAPTEAATVIPATSTETQVPTSESSPTAIETLEAAATQAAPIATFSYGIEANLLGQNKEAVATMVRELGVGWVKQVVHWRDMEFVPGDISFAELDSVVDALEAEEVNILLTITSAPDWARSIQEEEGPPDDFADFGRFMTAVANRYAGRMHAYQIWNEPNIRNRWRSNEHAIGAAPYVELLQQGYNAVKAADPDAQIVTAGLAVTGFNDALNAQPGAAVNAVDDRVFLAGMYAAGVTNYADAIGAHPIGWANPPDARCCEPAEGVETHYENHSFYFLHTIEDYRQVQTANNDLTTPLWVTRFAWGTSEDIGQVDEANIFVSYTDLIEQAHYTTRAFEIGRELGYIGPMFAYNLNGCQASGRDGFSSCYYSFISITGSPRPVFGAVQAAITDSLVPDQTEVTEPVNLTSTPQAEATAEVSQ